MLDEVAAERAEEIHEHRHPQRLRNDEAREKQNLRCEVRRWSESTEFLLFVNFPFAGDFARGVVGSHQCEQHHLEHDDARDGGSHFRLICPHALLFLDLGEDIARPRVGKTADVARGFVAEDGDQHRKNDQDRELQQHLAAVAKEDAPTPREQSEELAGESRQGQRLNVDGRHF